MRDEARCLEIQGITVTPRAGGAAISFDLAVSSPYRWPDFDAWACDVIWSREDWRDHPIFGATPFQAVQLAVRFAETRLRHELDRAEVTVDGAPAVFDEGV